MPSSVQERRKNCRLIATRYTKWYLNDPPPYLYNHLLFSLTYAYTIIVIKGVSSLSHLYEPAAKLLFVIW